MKKLIAWYKRCRHRRQGEGTGWYYGNFALPEHGRYERHCLDCGRKEYSVYDSDAAQHWIAFK